MTAKPSPAWERSNLCSLDESSPRQNNGASPDRNWIDTLTRDPPH